MKNEIIIIVDGMLRDRLSCYGYNKETTPNINRILDKSTIYTNYIATNNATHPCFASMYFGCHPLEHGILKHMQEGDYSNKTWAQKKKEQGFHTLAIDNLYRGIGFEWVKRGFDEYITINYDGYNYAHEITDRFLSKEYKEPFFAVLHYYETREPFFSNIDYDGDKYDKSMHYLDFHIGRIIKKYPDAKIVITADHGTQYLMNGSDKYFGLEQDIINIPLIIYNNDNLMEGTDGELLSQDDLQYIMTDEHYEKKEIISIEHTEQTQIAITKENKKTFIRKI